MHPQCHGPAGGGGVVGGPLSSHLRPDQPTHATSLSATSSLPPHPTVRSSAIFGSDALSLPRVGSSSSLTTASPLSSCSPEAVHGRLAHNAAGTHSPMTSESTVSTPPPPGGAAAASATCSAGSQSMDVSMTPRATSSSDSAAVHPMQRATSSSDMVADGPSPDSVRSMEATETADETILCRLDTLAQAAMMSCTDIDSERRDRLRHRQSRTSATAAALSSSSKADSSRSSNPRQTDRPASVSRSQPAAAASSTSRLKTKLPPGVSSFNHSTYMSEVDFIRYFQRCSSLSEAVGAIGHDWPSYKSVSVYARARRLQLKYDSHGRLLLHGKAKQFVELGESPSATTLHSIWRGRKTDDAPAADHTNTATTRRAPTTRVHVREEDEEEDDDLERSDVSDVGSSNSSVSSSADDQEDVQAVCTNPSPRSSQLLAPTRDKRETRPQFLAPVTAVRFAEEARAQKL